MAGMAHQVFEQLELARQQVDRLAAARDRAGQEVDLEIGDPQPRRRRRRGAAPQQRLDAREQLAEGERLDEIVVAAGAQPLTRSSTLPSALRISAGVDLGARRAPSNASPSIPGSMRSRTIAS